MSQISELQSSILGALYLESTFEQLSQEINTTLPILKAELRFMIDRGWIHVLERQETSENYSQTAIFDVDRLENYAYVATKKGQDINEQYE